jgi:hypothetical protein
MFTRSALTFIAIVALTLSLPVHMASAHELGRHHGQQASATGSPYAEPLAAMDGRTLAQYLADHVEHRLTTARM